MNNTKKLIASAALALAALTVGSGCQPHQVCTDPIPVEQFVAAYPAGTLDYQGSISGWWVNKATGEQYGWAAEEDEDVIPAACYR